MNTWRNVSCLLLASFVLAGLFVSVVQARSPAPTLEALGDAFYRDLHRRDFVLMKEPTVVDSVDAYRDQLINRFGASAIRQSTTYMSRAMQSVLGERIRLRSNLAWDVEDGFIGSLEAGVPLLPAATLGPNAALAFQTGLQVWTGHRSQERVDINLGLVGRYMVGQGNIFALGMPALIYGGHFFFDINANNGLGRIGLGMDAQAERLLVAINGYIAVEDDWEDGDAGYEERVVSGFDVRADYDVRENATFSIALGGWENEDVNETGSDFEDFYFTMKLRGEWFVHSNFALTGDYDMRTRGSGQSDSAITLGVQAQWPGRDLRGRKGRDYNGNSMDLYRLVEREQRILYAERVKQIPTRPAVPGSSQGATQAEDSADVTFSITLDEAVPQGSASVEFFAYTSVASQYLPSGATAATAGTDFTAIPRPTTSTSGTTGESDESVQAQQTTSSCAASTPADCKLVIAAGQQEGQLTITGLLLDDEAAEDSKRFTVLFEPTPETRAVFGYSDEPVPAVVTILPSDADRTLRIVLPQRVFAEQAAANIPPIPLDFTFSKALDSDISMGVILTDTAPDPDRSCTVPVALKGGVLYQQVSVPIASCFGTGDTDFTFPAAKQSIGLNISLALPKESGESGTGEVFAATTDDIKHSFASLEFVESTTGTGDDAQRVLAIDYVEFLTNPELFTKQNAITSIIIEAIADASLARLTLKPTKPQFVEGVDANVSFSVSLSKALTEDLTIGYGVDATSSDAQRNSDYIRPADPRAVTIAAGDTTATINIPLIKDAEEEDAESIVLTITSFDGGGLAQISRGNVALTAIALIVDAPADQPAGQASKVPGTVDPVSRTEEVVGGGIGFTFKLDVPLVRASGASSPADAIFDVTTSSDPKYLADGATPATADTDYTAITDTAPVSAVSINTCTATLPADTATPCRLAIGHDATSGEETFSVLLAIKDDSDAEGPEQFAFLLTPTEATQTLFNWTADPIVVQVTILANDADRTMQVTLPQGGFLTPSLARLPTIPVDFTLSSALDSETAIGVRFTADTNDPATPADPADDTSCNVTALLVPDVLNQAPALDITSCFGAGSNQFPFPAADNSIRLFVSLVLPKESGTGQIFAATAADTKHTLGGIDLAETNEGTGADVQRVLAVATPTTAQQPVVSINVFALRDADKATYSLKPAKPQFVEGEDQTIDIIFSLSRAISNDVGLTFLFDEDGSSAEEGKDYVEPVLGALVNYAIILKAGQTSVTYSIPLIRDSVAEDPETLIVGLGVTDELVAGTSTVAALSDTEVDFSSSAASTPAAIAVIVDRTTAAPQASKAPGTIDPITVDEDDIAATFAFSYTLNLDVPAVIPSGQTALAKAVFDITTSSDTRYLTAGATPATADTDYVAITETAAANVAASDTCSATDPRGVGISPQPCRVAIGVLDNGSTSSQISSLIKFETVKEGAEQFAILLTPTAATQTAFNWTADPIVGVITIQASD